MKKTIQDYDWLKIIHYDWILHCLYFKDKCFLVYNSKEKELCINRTYYLCINYWSSKTLFSKINKFFRLYIWKTLINKNDFMNFINQCKTWNDNKIRAVDWYYFYWINLFWVTF